MTVVLFVPGPQVSVNVVVVVRPVIAWLLLSGLVPDQLEFEGFALADSAVQPPALSTLQVRVEDSPTPMSVGLALMFTVGGMIVTVAL